MGRRSQRSKKGSAIMAARVAAGLAPWTRMAGFIANRLNVLEAELQASQMQHGTDATASQQRDQQMQAQIEELQQQNARHRLTAYAAAEEMADLESQCFQCCLSQLLAIVHDVLLYPRPALLWHIHQTYSSSSKCWQQHLEQFMQLSRAALAACTAHAPPSPSQPPICNPSRLCISNPPFLTITSQPTPARPARPPPHTTTSQHSMPTLLPQPGISLHSPHPGSRGCQQGCCLLRVSYAMPTHHNVNATASAVVAAGAFAIATARCIVLGSLLPTMVLLLPVGHDMAGLQVQGECLDGLDDMHVSNSSESAGL
ncbi:hypothetical protein HaLaN_03153 [Haematococcus lacustris]|uniref:Uncharacterized protein n=1 Tax=Haematococcus lacustris TaxID=44745 RepID=A0A699YDW1_HAELA|nr:hypothetical protein HaLaN_03153 [Haematococcus lacustris]